MLDCSEAARPDSAPTSWIQRPPLPSCFSTRAGSARPDRKQAASPAMMIRAGVQLSRQVDLSESARSEEHTSELQSIMRNSYAVSCSKKNKKSQIETK